MDQIQSTPLPSMRISIVGTPLYDFITECFTQVRAGCAEFTSLSIPATGNKRAFKMLFSFIFSGLMGVGIVTAKSISIFTALNAVESSNFLHEIPEPLPSVMPDGVVNLFIQEMEGYAGLFEASVIKAVS